VRRLLQSDVALLIPVRDAIGDVNDRVIRGGLFAAARKEDFDRLISDRRAFNAMEQQLIWTQLPHARVLARLIIGPPWTSERKRR
jgi:hypothetical protein